jgi:hypothetical protein
MRVDNTNFPDRQRRPDQAAEEVARCREEWRAGCAVLGRERARLEEMRAALFAQERLVARLDGEERVLRTRLHMKTVLARLPAPAAGGECRPVAILGPEDDDGGRYRLRADGAYPDVFRIYDKALKSIAHVGPDEGAARARLAELRAAEGRRPAPRPRRFDLRGLLRRVSLPRVGRRPA